MDGTLIDTNFANFLSYKKAIQQVTKSEIDLAYNPDERFNREVLKATIPNLKEIDYNRLILDKEKFYNDFLSETKLNKKIYDILFRYSETNRTILVTNCREKRANATLDYYRIRDKFEDIIYRQLSKADNRINKFSHAISQLAISPQSIILFENENREIEDAIKAGIVKHNIFKI